MPSFTSCLKRRGRRMSVVTNDPFFLEVSHGRKNHGAPWELRTLFGPGSLNIGLLRACKSGRAVKNASIVGSGLTPESHR
jgi:hypothetical protein